MNKKNNASIIWFFYHVLLLFLIRLFYYENRGPAVSFFNHVLGFYWLWETQKAFISQSTVTKDADNSLIPHPSFPFWLSTMTVPTENQ